MNANERESGVYYFVPTDLPALVDRRAPQNRHQGAFRRAHAHILHLTAENVREEGLDGIHRDIALRFDRLNLIGSLIVDHLGTRGRDSPLRAGEHLSDVAVAARG